MSSDIAITPLKEKIDELNQQAWEARVNDSPRAFELSQQSVKLARDLNYPKGLAEGLRSLGFAYVRLYKNEEAAPLLRESLSLFQSLNDLKGQAVVYEYLGIIERNWGNLGSSLELLLKGYDLIRQVGAPDIEITCCYQIGVTYKHLGKHENALDYLYQALSLAKKIDFILMEGYAINIIGSIYFDNGDYNRALDCYQRGLLIRHESNDKWGEAGSLDNIGFTYLKLKDLDKAIDYCKQSLAISQSTGDKKGEANALLHLAEIYEQADDLGNAFKFSNESLEIRKARGDRRGEAEVLLFLAGLYKSRNGAEDHKVLDWLLGAVKIAEEIKAQDLLSKAYYNLHEYYSEKGDFKESLARLEDHLKIEKELHKNTINQKVSNLEISNKAEAISQRNKELTELNEQIEKANAELKIETALERVRTAAMAMKEPSDMLGICKIISHELASLEVKEIRNVQTAIFYEEKGSYMNYEYYSKHDKLLVTEVDYNNHPVAEKFANQMIKGANQVWTHAFKGQEVKDWLAYQKTTNVFIDPYLETAGSLDYYWYSLGPVALGMSTYASLNEGEIELFKRFRNVFELAYRRYMDIEKAYAQAREAQIEASLERVRAAAMAMHDPEDMLEVCRVISDQMQGLNVKDIRNVQTAIINQEKGIYLNYEYFTQYKRTDVLEIVIRLHPAVEEFANEMLKSKDAIFFKSFEGEALDDWREYRKKTNQDPDPMLDIATELHYYFYSIGSGALGISVFSKLNEVELELFKRFRNVFELAYRRFVDIEKAQAQAREAQIEASLERVRAKSMAMHHSDDLISVINVVKEQLIQLGFHFHGANFVTDYSDKGYTMWLAAPNESFPSKIYVPQLQQKLFKGVAEAVEKGLDFTTYTLSFEEKNTYFNNLFENSLASNTSEEGKKLIFESKGMAASVVLLNKIRLNLMNLDLIPYTDEENNILKRIAYGFEQSYIRFLDLKKAEAQAREAQIETALERIRARAMAMHSSNELIEVANILRDQMGLLGQPELETSVVSLYDKESGRIDNWNAFRQPGLTSGSITTSTSSFSKDSSELTREMATMYDIGKTEFTLTASGSKLLEFFEVLIKSDPLVANYAGRYVPDQVFYHFTSFTGGALLTVSYQPPSVETKLLQRRAASVFDMAYRRYLDLKKAEAQAREAQIEAALEKVRAKVMAMKTSNDLNEASLTFGEQLRKLGIDWQFSYFWLIEEEKEDNAFWITWPDGKTSTTTYSIAEADESFRECIIAWREQTRIHATHVEVQDVQAWLDTFERITQDAGGIAVDIMKPENFKQGVFYYDAMIRFGSFGILMNRETTEDERNIQSRFAVEFERAYTRFLDLQKAEAQTQKAKIETALEKVRARALAMQQPEELIEVAKVLRQEMGLLGVEELETCSIYIHDETIQRTECWYALKDIRSEEKKLVSDHFSLNLDDTWVGRKMLEFFRSDAKQVSIIMQGPHRKEWINYCEEKSVPFRGYYGEVIPDRTYHLYRFSHGAIGAASAGDISAESWDLLQRAASVFSLAYSRFKDLTQARNDLVKLKEEKKRAEVALTELQATQKQLVQSEKMASLGELTAGIAHEIQNPLNFVNNFSDVSNELLDEMEEELATGNMQSAKEIVKDVKDNLEKILHHGKRADAIVKSMLQHSRSSSSKKEPTDINALTEEYFRLAFHGLRAKDKSFNAKFETDLDASIDKVNIVPQEMGRVILNLINNAFYAVNEKKKTAGNGYEPVVTISTKYVESRSGSLSAGQPGSGIIEIKVKDNGNGIPQKILDKIFQPFFTTKPTGQGTGLGLSLSYDIITKGHGGDIKVQTKEGEGSEFIISLPMNN